MPTHAYARTFVPQHFDPGDFAQIAPLYAALEARAIGSAADLEKFLLDFSELSSVVDEYSSRRYIDKSCHTDDPAIEAAFMKFVEQVEPRCKEPNDRLQKKFLASPFLAQLKGEKYALLARQWQADVDVFREANVPLETEVTKFVNEYDKLSAAQMVDFRGKAYTQQQLGKFVEQPDRATREAAWVAGSARRLQDREAMEKTFDDLLSVRETMAKNAGCANYRDLIWKSYKRFDYTPADCEKFADAVEAACMPLVHALDRERQRELNVDALRPWDLSVDPKSNPPLRPFDEADIDGFVAKTRLVFGLVNPQLGEEFDSLRRNKNLDLGSRKGKQPGGYQSTLNESREPFIFMNAAGTHRDVTTMLHEGGHAFHAIAAKDEPVMFLRHAPMEFCEVASMAMELFGNVHLETFYAPGEANRARRQHLEGIIRLLPWIATVDGFQHWLYTHPGHSHAERTAQWLKLVERFGSKLDWTGHRAALEAGWQKQLHLYHAPFYYIEYGIAQLGALQLWMKAQEDPARALAGYRAGLKLGGTRTLPGLFNAAGITFDFSEKTIKPVMNAVREALGELAV